MEPPYEEDEEMKDVDAEEEKKEKKGALLGRGGTRLRVYITH